MARQREIMVGSRDRFAVKIAFLDGSGSGTRRHKRTFHFLGCYRGLGEWPQSLPSRRTGRVH